MTSTVVGESVSDKGKDPLLLPVSRYDTRTSKVVFSLSTPASWSHH